VVPREIIVCLSRWSLELMKCLERPGGDMKLPGNHAGRTVSQNNHHRES